MAVNPFELLKQLQGLQSKVGEMQEKLKAIHVTGSSGGGMVSVQMDGDWPRATTPGFKVHGSDLPWAEAATTANENDRRRTEMCFTM